MPPKTNTVYLLCSDPSFARLLLTELQLLHRHAIHRRFLGDLPPDAQEVLLDIDVYDPLSLPVDCTVYGFSRHEQTLPPEVISRCASILHRPFLMPNFRALFRDERYAAGIPSLPSTRVEHPVLLRRSLPLQLDRERRVALLGDKEILLTREETIVLACLMDAAGEAVSRHTLLSLLSGLSTTETGANSNPGGVSSAQTGANSNPGGVSPAQTGTKSNLADVYVCFLRRKFAAVSRTNYILSVRGVGYRLVL